MRTRTLFFVLLALGAGVALTLRAGDPDSGALRYPVTGLVLAPADGAVVSIAHDEIPGFMPAMTMPFTLASEAEAARLRPGDRVRFTLRLEEGRSSVEDVEVVGTDPAGLRRIASAATVGRTRLSEGDVVMPFRLTDQSGAPVTEADLAGKVTVVSFIFTRCPVPEFCPLIMTRLRTLQDRTADDAVLRDRVRLLAITLDPGFDTPELLKAYGEAKGADFSRWRLATGTRDEIDALTAAFAVVSRRTDVSIDHTLTTAIIGPDGTVGTLLRGNAWKMEEALEAIRAQAAR